MAEHDLRFKRLLKEFFREFLMLFFPKYAADLDFDSIEWLDKEMFAAALGDEVRLLDLVAKLRRRCGEGPADLMVIVHVEIESRDAVAMFRPRMYHYYEALRRSYDCLVLPIAVYLRVGLDGLGIDTYVETYDDLEVLRFRYLYVGLPALDANEYVAGENWLGVALAALMRMADEDRARLRAEALRRVAVECRENEVRRFYLSECIDAYLTLDETQQLEFAQLLRTPRYEEVIPMMTTMFEKGVAKGLEEGMVQGQRRTARLLLEKKFGPLHPLALQRLEEWPSERLDELLLALLDGPPSLQTLGLED